MPHDGRAALIASMAATVDRVRPDALTDAEMSELDIIAFGYHRSNEKKAVRALTVRRIMTFAREHRETSLIASMSTATAMVQPWSGVIGSEGVLTGDGRAIAFGALTWAAFPMPLRYAPADLGGHDGAVLVGRIDSVTRDGDGTVRAWGVLDLGSAIGREVARLIRAGMLSGVSMDLDSTATEPVKLAESGPNKSAAVTTSARVRAATLVSIPAFDNARIALDGEPRAGDDCGCDDPTPGVYSFIPIPKK